MIKANKLHKLPRNFSKSLAKLLINKVILFFISGKVLFGKKRDNFLLNDKEKASYI